MADVRAGDARGVTQERVVGHDTEILAALELDLAALVGQLYAVRPSVMGAAPVRKVLTRPPKTSRIRR